MKSITPIFQLFILSFCLLADAQLLPSDYTNKPTLSINDIPELALWINLLILTHVLCAILCAVLFISIQKNSYRIYALEDQIGVHEMLEKV